MVCSLLSNSLVSFEWFVPCSEIYSSPFRAICSLFSNCLVVFEPFAPCPQILQSFSSGVLVSLPSFESFSSGFLFFPQINHFFGAACSLFSKSLVFFERSAPCSQILYISPLELLLLVLYLASFERVVLKFPPFSQILSGPFRAVCSLFTKSLISLFRAA